MWEEFDAFCEKTINVIGREHFESVFRDPEVREFVRSYSLVRDVRQRNWPMTKKKAVIKAWLDYYSRCGRVDLCNTLFVKAGEKMTMGNPPHVTETEFATLTSSPDVRPRPVCPEIGGKCMTGICQLLFCVVKRMFPGFVKGLNQA
jgi:hypothetical protein